jgi:hypothetical protein
MNSIRNRLLKLEQRQPGDGCKECAANPISIRWVGRDPEPEPCGTCARYPIVIDWALAGPGGRRRHDGQSRTAQPTTGIR